MTEKKGLFKKVFFVILILILIIYFAGVYYFSKYTYPNTIVNGKNLSFESIDSIFDDIELRDITIVDKDGKEYPLSPKELSFTAEYERDINIEQNIFIWPVEILSEHLYDNPVTKKINEGNLKIWINNSGLLKNIKAPQDAKIAKENDEYIIKKEDLGNTIDVDKLFSTIEKAFFNSKESIVLKSEYTQPTVFEKDLAENKELLNKLLKANISIKLNDGTIVKLVDMESFVNEKEAKVDLDKVKEYVNGLKNQYDNINKTRTFKSSAGNEISVQPGNFGTQIHLDKTTAAIYEALNKAEETTVDLVYTATSLNNGEIGNTYIEISLADQNMWFYKDGNLVTQTPVITGRAGWSDTPKGVWKIFIKEQNRYLRGKNYDGTKYESWVNYWMQITGPGVGIHDSSWQSSYGGNLYKTARGSHGCINTPLNIVRTIYENVDNGTPVIIY